MGATSIHRIRYIIRSRIGISDAARRLAKQDPDARGGDLLLQPSQGRRHASSRAARPFAFLPSSATSPAVRAGRRSPSDRSQAPSLARSPSSCRRTASDGSKGPWRPTLNVSVAAIPTTDWGANLKGASTAVGRRVGRRRDGRSSCKALARPCPAKINDYELGQGRPSRGEIVEIAGRPGPLQAQARHVSMWI
jgi:hypothetical protein